MRLLAFLNVVLCPLYLSLNVFLVNPIYVSLLSLVVTVAYICILYKINYLTNVVTQSFMPLQTILRQLKKFCLLIALTVRYCLFARACFRVLRARGFRSRASVLSRQESSLVQTFGEDFASFVE